MYDYNKPPQWAQGGRWTLNRKAFGRALAHIENAYRIKFNPDQLSTWEQLFCNCKTEEFAWGVQYLFEKCKSFPTPSWIFEGIDVYRENVANNGGI